MQPVTPISDTEIVGDFDSLSQHIHNWVEVELSEFEETHPKTEIEDFFSNGGNSDAARLLKEHSSFGEYLVRYEIYRILQEQMLGDEIYLLGLKEEYKDTLEIAEKSMLQLKPHRGV